MTKTWCLSHSELCLIVNGALWSWWFVVCGEKSIRKWLISYMHIVQCYYFHSTRLCSSTQLINPSVHGYNSHTQRRGVMVSCLASSRSKSVTLGDQLPRRSSLGLKSKSSWKIFVISLRFSCYWGSVATIYFCVKLRSVVCGWTWPASLLWSNWCGWLTRRYWNDPIRWFRRIKLKSGVSLTREPELQIGRENE